MIRIRPLLMVLGVILSVAVAGPGAADRAGLETALRRAYAAGELAGLHGVLILHKGQVVTDLHFDGRDERWGKPLGLVAQDHDTLHDVRSITKSVVALLYGIALSEGIVPGLDESLIAQFPDYTDLAADPARRAITVRHALTMTMGTRWDEETRPYSDPRNSEIAMERAADRYRFVLGQPIVAPAGQRWTYSGGAVAVIARLIEQGAGMPIDAYARKVLFQPLGIRHFEWVRGADGTPSAASGLRLSLHDLGRIGELVMQDGVYQGKRVVASSWLKAVMTPVAKLEHGMRYGFYWWLSPQGTPPVWGAAMGNGGQRLSVNRGERLVFVVLAGNYNRKDSWQLAVKISRDFLEPWLFGKP